MMEARIEERGNGLPDVGAYVYDATDDTVYVIVECHLANISSTPGRGRMMDVVIEEYGDAASLTKEEWDDMTEVNIVVERNDVCPHCGSNPCIDSSTGGFHPQNPSAGSIKGVK